jgi:peptidoglycan-associated lipoprotein
MKFAVRLSAIAALLAAVVTFTGCKDAEPGKGGTIPPAWDEPGTPRVDNLGDGRDDSAVSKWKPEDAETPGAWGVGANDGVLDERTGVRRIEVAGFPKTLYFGFDTDRVSASELSKVAEAADFMRANSGMVLVIEGHCDERGTEEYNRALGERRAIAVENQLRSNGIDLANIRTVSYGEDKPAVAGSGESAWSQNRRAVLWVGKAAN